MGTLSDDIKYAAYGKNLKMFGFIYSRTNEDLLPLFSQINVDGKDVYTVLSSSDYLFSAIDGGAKKVDAFDINPLTYRYYHLRKWLLQYGLIDADGLSIDSLLRIVNRHLPPISTDEKESAIFWKNYLDGVDTCHFYSDALFSYTNRPEVTYADNIIELVKKLNSREIVFDTIDMCQSIDINRKYDTVFMSNILDYNRIGTTTINIAMSNLYSILNNRGRVVLSHFQHFPKFDVEKSIFSSCFDYDEIFSSCDTGQDITYYQYTKK